MKECDILGGQNILLTLLHMRQYTTLWNFRVQKLIKLAR